MGALRLGLKRPLRTYVMPREIPKHMHPIKQPGSSTNHSIAWNRGSGINGVHAILIHAL